MLLDLYSLWTGPPFFPPVTGPMMGNARILTGPRFNFLSRAAQVTTVGDSPDPLFPVANLWDDRPGTLFRFLSNTANSYLFVDLQQFTNWNFEGGFTAGVGNGWTKTGGTASSEGTIVYGGLASQRLDAAAGIEATIAQYFTARPGEFWKVAVFTRCAGSSGTKARSRLYVLNELTNNWWTGAAWSSVATIAATVASTSFTELSATFQVESSPLLLWYGTCRLRAFFSGFQATSSGGDMTTYWDNAEAYPALDFAGIFGHNMDASIVPSLQYSTDTSTSGGAYPWAAVIVASTMGLLPLSFYSVLAAPVYARWWRLIFQGQQVVGGTPGAVTPLSIGEFVLGLSTVLLRTEDYGVKTKHREFQTRAVTTVGDQYVYVLGGGPTRTLQLAYTETATSEYQQVRDAVFRTSRGGRDSCVLVPWDADPDVCVYGRVSMDLDETRDLLSYWKLGLTVVEAPFPLFL